MIIWQGFGFLAMLIPILCYVIVVKLCQSALSIAYTNAHSWPGALGTLIGALGVWLLAKKLDQPGSVVMDVATGKQTVLKKKHTLFFVPLLYVAGILAVVAIGMLFFKAGSPL